MLKLSKTPDPTAFGSENGNGAGSGEIGEAGSPHGNEDGSGEGSGHANGYGDEEGTIGNDDSFYELPCQEGFFHEDEFACGRGDEDGTGWGKDTLAIGLGACLNGMGRK